MAIREVKPSEAPWAIMRAKEAAEALNPGETPDAFKAAKEAGCMHGSPAWTLFISVYMERTQNHQKNP